MSDEDLLAAFEDCSLPSGSFHHEDHLRVAFLYLARYSCAEALQRFTTSLTRFAAAVGKPQLYHATITWAFVLVIHDRMARTGAHANWPAFAAANADLFDWKQALSRYYRQETLLAPIARRTFLFPDAAPQDAVK